MELPTSIQDIDELENIGWNVIIIPKEEYITGDEISDYELANIIQSRVSILGLNHKLWTDELPVAKISELPSTKLGNIKASDIVKIGGEEFVKLFTSADIAKYEINKKKCPFKVVRVIQVNHKLNTIHIELRKVNDLIIPPLEYSLNWSK